MNDQLAVFTGLTVKARELALATGRLFDTMLTERGATMTDVSKATGIRLDILSRFRSGQTVLDDKQARRVIAWLDGR